MDKQIIYYYTEYGSYPYKDWYNTLDKSIQVRVGKRVEKLQAGIYGDIRKLQNSELSELRMDFGAGYRIYYYDLRETLVLFVAGSDKKTQKKIVQVANEYFNDFVERNS